MKLGIIGNEAAKFTKRTEEVARQIIRDYIEYYQPEAVVSGHCPLGGVDIWAEEEAAKLHVPMIVHAPQSFMWNGPQGYKWRNKRIARDCYGGAILVVVVANLPQGFTGMTFEGCYHCKGRNEPHVKSGACWTAYQTVNCTRHWEVVK